MTLFPTSLDTKIDPLPTDLTNGPVDGVYGNGHAAEHKFANDAIKALEAKVGVDGSLVTTTHDYKLSLITGAFKAETIANKSTDITMGGIGASDILYPSQKAAKAYIDGIAIAGSPNASTILKGIVQEATEPQIIAGTAVGSTGARLFINPSTFITALPKIVKNLPTASSVVDLIATENLTIGQPVGADNLTAGQVSRGNRTKSSGAHGIPTSLFNGENNANYCAIGGDKFVMLNYNAAAGNTLFAQVASIDRPTLTMTLGTAQTVAVNASINGGVPGFLVNVAVCKLNTDKFVVFYLLNASSTDIKYRVGTVSGTTITFGVEATFFTAGSSVSTSNDWGADFISTDKGIMYFKAFTTTDSKMVAFTAAGTVLTVGAGVTPGAQSQSNTSSYIKKIGTDKYVLATADTSNSIYGQVCTLAGIVITAGAEVQLSVSTSSGAVSNLQVVSPATDVFVVRLQGSSTTIAGAIASTVVGTVITPGAFFNTVGTTGAFGQQGGIYAVSSSVLFITGGTPSAIYKVTLAGNTLTNVGFIVQVLSSVQAGGTIAMDNGYLVTVNLLPTGSNVDAWIQGMSNNFVGIAQSTVLQGATVTVIVRGVDINQSGLLPGGTYSVSNGVLNFVSSMASITTLDQTTNIVKAIDTTKIVV